MRLSHLDEIPQPIAAVCDEFLRANPFARLWSRYPDVSREMDETMPACEGMSDAFARFCAASDFDSVEVIEADESTNPEADYHRWVRLGAGDDVIINVDWTVRQYHNLEWSEELEDWAPQYQNLPTPMVWLGDGPEHPLVEFTRQKVIEVDLEPDELGAGAWPGGYDL